MPTVDSLNNNDVINVCKVCMHVEYSMSQLLHIEQFLSFTLETKSIAVLVSVNFVLHNLQTIEI